MLIDSRLLTTTQKFPSLAQVLEGVGNMLGVGTLLGEGALDDEQLGHVLGGDAAGRDRFVRQHHLNISIFMSIRQKKWLSNLLSFLCTEHLKYFLLHSFDNFLYFRAFSIQDFAFFIYSIESIRDRLCIYRT